MKILKLCTPLTIFGVLLMASFPVIAGGQPSPWGIDMQEAASDSAARIQEFHTLLLWITGCITAFVFFLLLYVVLRFNKKANPIPSKITHNVMLEIVWTLVPVMILVVISIKSFTLLYVNDRIEKPDMTLKVKGFQWYWSYEYPELAGLSFDSRIVAKNELKEGQVQLLSTDNVVVLPIDTNIQILVTANDVIHAWTVPALGVKIDAVPGRMNETWFRINKVGVYYGQCSEICGKDHSYMPIEIHAVTKEEYAAWTETAKVQFALNDNSMPVYVALAKQ